MVLIKFKTLQGKEFSVDGVQLTQTVNELKAAVEAAPPVGEAFPADRLKLIHQGKELVEGTNTLSSYHVCENDLIIVMLSRPKPASSSVPPSTSSTTTAAPTLPTPAPAPAPAPAPPPAPPSIPCPNPMVEQLKEMGFPESQVVAALRAANQDPNVAIEFLFSGNIPASPSPSSSLPSSASTGLDLMPAVGEGGRGGGEEGEERMGGQADHMAVAQFLSHPEMENIRRIVRENPSSMESAIGALAVSHPDFVRLINEDPASFWAALEGGGEEGEFEEEDDEDEGGGDGGEEGGVGVLEELTEEDEQAVMRLMEMGFGREQVVEAYLLAGKDENGAVNLLLGG